MANTHKLKTWPEFYDKVGDGSKTFEIRENDRDFKVGDTLVLREWDPEKKDYTGRELKRGVSYVIQGFDAIQDGYCIMGLCGVIVESEGDTSMGACAQSALATRYPELKVPGLRDQFAVVFLAAWLSGGTPMNSDAVTAEAVYKMADAMLAEREKATSKRPVEIGFDGPGGTRITGRVVGEDGGDWILDLGAEGLIRRKKQGGEDDPDPRD